MEFLWLLVLAAATIGILYYRYSAHKQKAVDSGAAVSRKDSFFKQAHVFTTTVKNLAEVGNAIDKSSFGEYKLRMEPDYNNRFIEFFCEKFGATFTATLQPIQADGDKFKYVFMVESYSESRDGRSAHDIVGANIALTQIERAFMKLDSNTEVERIHGEYKSKTKWF